MHDGLHCGFVSSGCESLLLLVFSSKTFSSPIFLNWFEGVRSALSEADSHLASFVASGRGDFLFLPSRSSSYAVHGDFALGGAAPINPSLLSLFERRLKPSHHVEGSIREAAALEARSAHNPRPCCTRCGSSLRFWPLFVSRISLRKIRLSFTLW